MTNAEPLSTPSNKRPAPSGGLRRALAYFAVGYLSVGLVLGSLLWGAIPAMNVLGWGYYALTWPAFIWHANTHIGPAPYVPSWAFTFRGER